MDDLRSGRRQRRGELANDMVVAVREKDVEGVVGSFDLSFD